MNIKCHSMIRQLLIAPLAIIGSFGAGMLVELAIEKGPISRDECLHIMTSALRVTLVFYALYTIKWLRARNKGKASSPTSK